MLTALVHTAHVHSSYIHTKSIQITHFLRAEIYHLHPSLACRKRWALIEIGRHNKLLGPVIKLVWVCYKLSRHISHAYACKFMSCDWLAVNNA